MLQWIRCLLGVVVLGCGVGLLQGEDTKDDKKDDKVENPLAKGWSGFNEGSTVTLRETVRYHGDAPDGKYHPDGMDQKDVTYKLLGTSRASVMVQAIVREYEFLSIVESAPTKISYPHMVKKSHLAAAWEKTGAKEGDEEIEVKGKKYKCHWYEWTTKGDGETTTHKLWQSSEVPGGTVKRTNITKKGEKVTAEGTITVLTFDVK